MKKSHYFNEILSCRVCGNTSLVEVLDLGTQCLSGVFPTEPNKNLVLDAPLKLLKCSSNAGCGLVQLSVSVDAELMYGDNYGYRSSLNSSMVFHLRNKVREIERMLELKDNDLVIDIGSNDGTTLKQYSNESLMRIGVDPTGNKFKSFYPDHIRLLSEYFPSKNLARMVNDKKASVITSFSMFYDLESPVEFARSIHNLLADEGVWVFEQSYLPAMLDTMSFDTVCHEHLEYYDIHVIKWICENASLKIIHVDLNTINGGSISVFAAKEGSSYPEFDGLGALLSNEEQGGYREIEIWKDFSAKVNRLKEDVLQFLAQIKANNQTILGLGASTKANTLLQYFGITPSLLDSIGEVNTEKYSCYTPGTCIPIISEQEVIDSKPDYIIVLPWHFREFFTMNPGLSNQKLVFCLPRLEVVNTSSHKDA